MHGGVSPAHLTHSFQVVKTMRDAQTMDNGGWTPAALAGALGSLLSWKWLLALVHVLGVAGYFLWTEYSADLAETVAPTHWRINVPQTRDGTPLGAPIEVLAPNEYGRIQEVALFELRDEQAQPVPLAPTSPQ